ncbi:uncharacterized protein LOC142975711 [Anticarsia gemmatalis]|uniref:uncharacterized protein LOC142975711 n=1 Tax=Anticarsia gemmatalis TaxID=129554 RepID=UPI003F76D9DF
MNFKLNNMYRAVLFAVLVALVSADEEKCRRVMGPHSMHCCKVMPMPKPDGPPKGPPADIKACFDIPMKPPSCAREECIGKIKGYYKDDGTVDKKVLAADLEKELGEKAPEIMKAIKENCIEGDTAKFGPPDMCELMTVKHCLHMQLLMNCPEWSDKDDCSGMKELVEECSKGFL